jgi:hypothetical protein
MNYINTAGWPSRDELLDRHAKGVTWKQIGEELGVGRSKIESYVKEGKEYLGAVHDRTATMAANRAFEAAMMKAIKAGREQASIGVFVDTTNPTWVCLSLPGAMFSGCGSAAAACLNPQWPR